MAGNYMGNMTFGVSFDTSKGISQLKEVQQALSKIGTLTTKDIMPSGKFDTAQLKTQLKTLQTQAANIAQAMTNSFNTAIGQIDMKKFNSLISPNYMNTFLGRLAQIGPTGYATFNDLQKSLTQTNDKLKVTHGFMDKMMTTFSNTVRWSIATKALQTITGSIQKAFYFTKDLDQSLNDIRIVTGKSADEMERFAKQATNAAQALGKTTTDYTKASLLFYQQGLGDREVAARAETTLKAANVTGQSASEVSEQLTAVWNGYRVTAAETEKYVDKLSAVAASTASNLEELSTGMSKVASAANMMGVDIDQLNAQLSTIISVTRQAPETIGAALKTVYSRMSTIQAGGIDEEDGATLTSYSAKMANFGVSVLDANGKLRDMGDVIEEIGSKWDTFSREAQIGLAQAMGGTRQYSNLTALFENWDKYQAALKVSQGAEGTLQKQQDIYMESLEAHFEQLTAEAEKLYQTIFDEDTIKDFTDSLTGLIGTINDIIKGFGGMKNVILMVGTSLASAFTPQISQGIMNIATFFQAQREKRDYAQAGIEKVNNNAENAKVFYNAREREINLTQSQPLRQQQQNQLNFQKELSEEINKIEKIYYSSYKTLSEEQQNALINKKKELEGLRDEGVEVAKLEEAYAKKAQRVLQSDQITSANIKQNTKLIDEERAKVEAFGKAMTEASLLKTDIKGINLSQLQTFNSVETANPEAKKDFEGFLQLGANNFNNLKDKKTYSEMNDNNEYIAAQLAKDLQKFQQELGDLTYKEIQNQYEDLIKRVEDSLKNHPNSKSLNSIKNELEKGYKKLDNRMSQYAANAVASKEKIAQNIAQAIEKTQTSFGEITNRYEEIKEKLPEEVKNEIDNDISQLQNLLTGLQDKDNVSNMDGDAINIEIDKINAIKARLRQNLANNIGELTKTYETLESEGAAINQLSQNAEYQKKVIQKDRTEEKIAQQQRLQGITQTITGLSRLASSINMIYNMFSNLRDMKPHEMALQFLMVAPMVISSLSAIKTGITAIGTAINTAIPIIGVIVVALASIITLFQLIKDAAKDELAESLEKAKRKAEELKEETEKCKTAYDNLVSALKTYNESLSVMETAKKDSQEYADALKEANDQILDLISNNAKLAKYFTRDAKTGLLTLKPEYSQESLEKILNDEYLSTQRQSYQADIVERELQQQKTTRDVANLLTYSDFDASILVNNSAFKDSSVRNKAIIQNGLSLFSMQNPIGKDFITNAEKTVLSNVITNVINAFNQPQTKEELEKQINSALSKFGASINLTDADTVEINKLIEQRLDNEALYQFQAKESTRSYMQQYNIGDYNNQSAEVQGVISSIVGKTYSDIMSIDIIQQAIKVYEDFATKNDEVKSQLTAFAREYAESKNYNIEIKDDGKIIYTDSEGKEVETKDLKDFATDAAVSSLEKRITELIEKSSEEKIKTINRIDEISQKMEDQFSLEGLSSALTSALTGETNFSFLQKAPRDLVENFKNALNTENDFWDNIPDEAWQELGFESRDAFIQGIQEALDKDYSVKVAIETEIDRNYKGYQAFNGLEQEWYEDKKISDESMEAIKAWLEDLGQGTLYESLQKAIESGKWELIADAIKEIKVVLDKELPKTKEEISKLRQEYANDAQKNLTTYKTNSGQVSSDALGLKLNEAKKGLTSASSVEDIQKVIDLYKEQLNGKLSKKFRESIEKDIEVLEEWRDSLDDTEEKLEGLNSALERQKKEVYYVVNEADGVKEAMKLIGEGWKVGAEDAQTFLTSCKDIEKYIEQVNQDGSLQISEAGVTEMATQKLTDLKNHIAQVEIELEIAQQRAANFDGNEEEWDALNQEIEEQIYLLSILRAAYTSLTTSISTAGTDHSKSSGSTKKAIEGFKSVIDIYHDIDIEIKKIKHDMAVLEKQSEFLVGKKAEKNLKTQLQLLKEQNQALIIRSKIAADEAATLRTQKVNDDGSKGLSAYGVKFAEDGTILNYFDVLKEKQDEAEAARVKFNKSRSDSDEKYYNKKKKELDDLKSDISEYEGYLDDIRQMEEEYLDNLLKITEQQLKSSEFKIKAKLDISEMKKQILQFKKDMGAWTIDLILNPSQSAIDAVTTGKASRQSIKASENTLDAYGNSGQKLVDVILALKDAKSNDVTLEWEGEEYNRTQIPQLVEKLQEMSDTMVETFNDIKQVIDDARESYINALQELQDWNEKVLAKFDLKNNMFDHADKLASLLYGEDSLQAKITHENIANQKVDNLYLQAQEANRIAEESYQNYLKAVESGDEKVAQEAYNIWADNIQKLNNLTESLVESRINLYKQQVDRLMSEFDMGVFNGQSLEEFTDQWDLINQKAELYLDTINAEFGVEQLRNKYAQAYNKMAGNTKAQEKINKIMNEELSYLKEKDKLTKYDLERAEAKYDLTLKQIALEEARENKTTLRLRRDSQGNYTYQYTANQDEILKAESEFAIAQNNLYNMDRDRVNEMTQDILDLYQQFADERAKILSNPEYINNQELMNQKLQELQDKYFGSDGFITKASKEYGEAVKNVQQSIDDILNNPNKDSVLSSFNNLQGNLEESLGELVQGLNPSIQAIIDKFKPSEDGGASSLADGISACWTACQEYQTSFLADVQSFVTSLSADTALGGVTSLYSEAEAAVLAFKNQCEQGIDLTNLGNVTTAINTLANALGDEDGKGSQPNLTGNADAAFEALTELVNPEKFKTNLEKIASNFINLTTTVGSLKDKIDTAIGSAQSFFNLLDTYSKKKWSFNVDTPSFSGGGGTSTRPDGSTTPSDDGGDNDDDDGTEGELLDPTPIYVVRPTSDSTTGVYYFSEENKKHAEIYRDWLKKQQFPSPFIDQTTLGTLKILGKSSIQLSKLDGYKTGYGGAVTSIGNIINDKLIKLNTGGYTGTWGNEGKLAMLHEKELVLNKDDTANMLKMLDIIRQIDVQKIESNMIDSYLAARGQMLPSELGSSNQSAQINQTITINADFPDASDRDEIKAAFDSLVNLASQRAMEKRY